MPVWTYALAEGAAFAPPMVAGHWLTASFDVVTDQGSEAAETIRA